MPVAVVNRTALLVVDKSILNCKEGIRRGLLDVGPEIEREVSRLIKTPPKTGRLYMINGRIHQASAPGEAPADLTGVLADMVGTSVEGSNRLIIGDRAPYGKWLEGQVKNRIAPRPHLKPGALNKAREVEQALNRAVKRQLGKNLI